jgi:hypothetical protein
MRDRPIGFPRTVHAADLNDAADRQSDEISTRCQRHVMCPPVGALEDEIPALVQFIDEALGRDPPGDGTGTLGIEDRKVIAGGSEGTLHRPDNIAAFAELPQRRFHIGAQHPDAGPLLLGETQLGEVPKPAQA